MQRPSALYLPRFEHDACGLGLLVDLAGRATHGLVEAGLAALARLAHRGGSASLSGQAARGDVPNPLPPDGAGALTEIPWALAAGEGPRSLLEAEERRAAGMFFFPPGAAPDLRARVAPVLARSGWQVVAWRPVPVDTGALRPAGRARAPEVWQAFALDEGAARDRDRRLYRARIELDHLFAAVEEPCGLVSLSRRTIVYKGLVEAPALGRFYPDLRDPRFTTRLMIVHERFSTNTFPRWELAQPFHLLAHNGEINTIAGNRLWMMACQRDARALGDAELAALGPLVRTSGSDSQSLDDAVALLVQGGYSLPHALARLIPPAWETDPRLSPDERAFFAFQSALAEPWDGPAAIAFSDGRLAGALLDRNGLRPARFIETADGRFLLGSEAGMFDVADGAVVRRGRLGPGEMVTIDVETGEVCRPAVVRRDLAAARPYRQWVTRATVVLPGASAEIGAGRGGAVAARDEGQGRQDRGDLLRRQQLFGYTREELAVILRPMMVDGREAVGSMGDDTPLAALSRRGRLLSDFFRQRFAQVTNPPIDPLRERAVMSLRVVLGPRLDLLHEDRPDRRWVVVPSPILSPEVLEGLAHLAELPAAVLALTMPRGGGAAVASRAGRLGVTGADLEHRLAALVDEAVAAVDAGAALLILSDASAGKEALPIPPLLATAAVSQGLVAAGRRLRASLIVETGEARDAHQVATLLAFGASAVCPALAYETVVELAPELGLAPDAALDRYCRALDEGLLKIFARMGISTASGYIGAELFEILGLHRDLVARYFPGVPCQMPGGVDLEVLARQIGARHRAAFEADRVQLEYPGLHGYRRDGEYHANNPAVVRALHRAVRRRGSEAAEAYAEFARLVTERPPTALRDLLEFRSGTPVPLEEVEPVEAICRRFFTSAMSVGALAPEAHRALALAMNRLGARSNSGEGGEEPERWQPRQGADSTNSGTKQVASARFGVTPAYLVAAEELQIKIAQGSKPGEGGQLPASKAVPHIARLRYAQPGITLISPPPHHDIYSIEDLAQLIYDLREVNPTARINVKLVAQAGVGIVAAGVVKAGAEAVLVSGHDGGTGASPRASIKHAGSPWELGLAETHQVLTLNGLRDRVVLQVDGGLKTGRDVAIAAALGADEFGFGTAALIALGCVMARQCHLNTCPAGIATQDPERRARFKGTPETVMRYFELVAQDVRQILAALGLRRVADLVGRVDLLDATRAAAYGVDLTPLLARVAPPRPRPPAVAGPSVPPRGPLLSLNERILHEVTPVLGRRPVHASYAISNTDRAVGAQLAGVVARQWGDRGVPAPVRLSFKGSAGQSFGAFLVPGLELDLVGEANDYLGKGMHGGQIVVRCRRGSLAADRSEVLAGNTVLYGATGGRVFIAGAAGERFAVRNSGATAVVEGVGDHGCEYMTGGLVVILGAVGRNFAAGMTGGVAYVWDPHGELDALCNRDLVEVGPIEEEDLVHLETLVSEHYRLTGSRRAARVLASWREARLAFRKVAPRRAEQRPWAADDGTGSSELVAADPPAVLRRTQVGQLASSVPLGAAAPAPGDPMP